MAEPTRSAQEAPPGRQATRPRRFTWRDWRAILGRVWVAVGTHHISIVAAGVGFFAVLAIFPAIGALIAFYGLVANPQNILSSLDAAEAVLPRDVHGMIAAQVQALIDAPQSALGVTWALGLGATLWTARMGVGGLMEGLNVVYGEVDDRPIWRQYLLSLVLTLMTLALAIVALIAVVALPALLRFSDIGPAGAFLARTTPFVVLGGAAALGIGAFYRFGPHRAPARVRWLSWGAVAATLAWVAVSMALSVYFGRFADLNRTYGAIGAVAGLLLWLYASAFVVLLGAELNAQMELQTEKDTTTGRPKPMGSRGAYVADHVA